MWPALATRPDLAYSVQTLSQFSSNPTETHWTATSRVLRYLNGTRDLGITLGGLTIAELVDLLGYSDADWGSNPVDRRSISGFAFLLGKSLISWNSKKQPTVALSSMEAEYMAVSHAAREAIWLRNLLLELGLTSEHPTLINVDNQGAIDFSKSQTFHGRSKHIDIRHHFIRERISSQEIEVTHCASEDNLADVLTKALPFPKHWNLILRLGMSSESRGSVGVLQSDSEADGYD
jgi:hypothetical protein